MYIIHGDYTGSFPLEFPFRFVSKQQSIQVCVYLNVLRKRIKEWEGLKEFKVWDNYKQDFILPSPKKS